LISYITTLIVWVLFYRNLLPGDVARYISEKQNSGTARHATGVRQKNRLLQILLSKLQNRVSSYIQRD